MTDLTPVAIEQHIRECSIEWCGKRPVAKGWCSMHYSRWKRHGDPTIQSKWRKWTFYDRTSGKWDVSASGCWEWSGAKQSNGYGVIRVLGETIRAHRYVYEHMAGRIPDGMELDHLCRNPPCVNPGHLEPVTHEENMRRAAEHWDRPHPSLSASECPNGHEMTDENTYSKPGGGARCRECSRAAWRRWNARRNKKVSTDE